MASLARCTSSGLQTPKSGLSLPTDSLMAWDVRSHTEQGGVVCAARVPIAVAPVFVRCVGRTCTNWQTCSEQRCEGHKEQGGVVCAAPVPIVAEVLVQKALQL